MSLTHRWISRILALSFLVVGVSCLTPPQTDQKPLLYTDEGVDKDGQSYYSKVYYHAFENVWRAAQLSVKYPIAINNMDNGVLETEWIKSVDGFTSPLSSETPTAGYRYKLAINMVKGKVDAKKSVRVTVRKKIEKQQDFFSEVESIHSDGLEEKTILYRIEREIVIDEAIKKAAKVNGP